MSKIIKTPSNSPIMGRIATHVNELCPEGVEIQPLGDVCEILRGKRVTKSDIKPQGTYPVISGGITPMGYMEDYNREPNTITVSQYGTAGYVDFQRVKFWANDICYCLYPKQNLNNEFLWYVLKDKQNYLYEIRNTDATPFSLPSETLKSVQIPLPPLSIQQEIVSVLDTFTTLIDKMKQEVEKRKKQMEYYCDLYYGGDIEGMMALANDSNNSVITFAELGTITRGKRFVRDDVRESGQPCIHYGDMYTYYGTKSYRANTYLDRDFPKKMRYANKGDVVIVGAGENDYDIGVGVVWMGDESAAVHDACYILEHSQNPMYISYYLRSNIYHQQLKKYVSSGKISSFSAEGLGKVYIPIQPIEKQNEIVSTLDKFESYITKLEKMIVLRQKQYEYYREQLLTFENIKH